MDKKSIFLSWVIFVSILLTGLNCFLDDVVSPEENPPEEVKLKSKVVSTDWLDSNLTKNGLVVVDVRSEEAYLAGHIENSVNIPFAPVSAWSANNGDLLVELPEISEFEDALGYNGISNESSVILVTGLPSETDPYALASPTRAALTLAYAGLKKFAILDGGYDKWADENKAVTTETTEITPTTFDADANADMFVDMEYVNNNLETVIIVDARDAEVYSGEVIEPFADKAGHIPNAVSLPASSLWTDEGTYKTKTQIKNIVNDAVGNNKKKEIIVYCGVGGYASTVWFVLTQILDYTNVKVYDGSAQEWVMYYDMEDPNAVELQDYLVSTDWLESNLTKSGLVVVDVRSEEAYLAGHIENSVNIPFAPVSAWAAMNGDLLVELPDITDFSTAMGEKGISNGSRVVLVTGLPSETDPYALAGPTRVALTLAYAGFEKVAVLDGGYEKWADENKAVTTETTEITPATFTADANADMFVDMVYVNNNLETVTIVDARDAEVYSGEIIEPFADKAGHIPNALSLPAPSFWTENGTYISKSDMQDIATDVVGSDKDIEIIAYCGVGGYASTVWFVLTQILDYTNVKVYDGSAQEWVMYYDMEDPNAVELQDYLVSTDWLESNLTKSGLVVVDVRSEEAYLAGHIENSVNIPFAPVSAWAAMNGDLLVELPDITDFSTAMGEKGISNGSSVVLVTGLPSETDPYALAGPTRVALTLAYAGFEKFAVLDGGYEKWADENKAVTTETTEITPATFTADANADMFVDMVYVNNNLETVTIVDARDAEVYSGEIIEPFADKAGHIPNALSLPAPSFWTENGTYISESDMQDIATDVVGSDKDKEIIVYCGVGGYASTVWFVLTQILDYTNVKVYDGSAQEWVLTYDMEDPNKVELQDYLVSTDWLESNLTKSGLVVVDVRSEEAYLEGHIENSVNIPFAPVSAWAAMNGDLLVELPDITGFSTAMGEKGISKGSSVVLVTGLPSDEDPYALASPTRAGLTLAYAGLKKFAILDGGYEKWADENKAVTTETTEITPATFTADANADMFVDMEYVNNNLETVTIVDARDAVVYSGEVIEPFADKAGHIPNALSLPAPSFWTENGTYISESDMQDIATDVVGSDKDKEIIVYCGVGGYASTVWFALTQILDYKNVKVYDGSAQEWVMTYDMEVEQES